MNFGSASTTINVLPTVKLTGGPLLITCGQSNTVNLDWQSSGITSCTLDPFGTSQPTSGSTMILGVTQASTFTMNCNGGGYSDSSSVSVACSGGTINVQSPSVTSAFNVAVNNPITFSASYSWNSIPAILLGQAATYYGISIRNNDNSATYAIGSAIINTATGSDAYSVSWTPTQTGSYTATYCINSAGAGGTRIVTRDFTVQAACGAVYGVCGGLNPCCVDKLTPSAYTCSLSSCPTCSPLNEYERISLTLQLHLQALAVLD